MMIKSRRATSSRQSSPWAANGKRTSRSRRLVSRGLLVGLGRRVVLLLLGLVRDGVTSSLEAVRRVSMMLCQAGEGSQRLTECRRRRCCPWRRPCWRPWRHRGWWLCKATSVSRRGPAGRGKQGGHTLKLVRDVVAGVLDGVHDGRCWLVD